MSAKKSVLINECLIAADGPGRYKFAMAPAAVPGLVKDGQPFYWSRKGNQDAAPSGWYQWLRGGLVYIGESILERA
jgi:hypothetical protein